MVGRVAGAMSESMFPLKISDIFWCRRMRPCHADTQPRVRGLRWRRARGRRAHLVPRSGERPKRPGCVAKPAPCDSVGGAGQCTVLRTETGVQVRERDRRWCGRALRGSDCGGWRTRCWQRGAARAAAEAHKQRRAAVTPTDKLDRGCMHACTALFPTDTSRFKMTE